jgi:hypothetical protein
MDEIITNSRDFLQVEFLFILGGGGTAGLAAQRSHLDDQGRDDQQCLDLLEVGFLYLPWRGRGGGQFLITSPHDDQSWKVMDEMINNAETFCK